jgi:hypothetical protein
MSSDLMFNLGEVVDLMQLQVDEVPNLPSSPEIVALAHRLVDVNAELWQLEDDARNKLPDYAAVGRVKECIDIANQRRNDIIGQIDEWIAADLRQAGVATNTSNGFTETIGQAFDRVAILMLRIKSLHTLANKYSMQPASPEYQMVMQRLAIAMEQKNHVVRVMRPLLVLIYTGQARHISWKALKLYNTPALRMPTNESRDVVESSGG